MKASRRTIAPDMHSLQSSRKHSLMQSLKQSLKKS
jgi:hypothetical protein